MKIINLGLLILLSTTYIESINQVSYPIKEFSDVSKDPATLQSKSELTEKEKQQIIDGTQGYKEFTKFLDEKDFLKTLLSVNSITRAIFNIGPAVTYISFIIISQEPSEMKIMKSEFGKDLNRIESWFNEFQQLKSMIEWNEVKFQFEEIETSILTLLKLIATLPSIGESDRESQAKSFIDMYETDYKSAAQALHAHLMNTDLTYSDNLLRASQKFMKFYRTQVQAFMVGMLHLLTQAIYIESTYISLKHDDSEDYLDYTRSLWDKKLSELVEKMKVIDVETTNAYKTQYEVDLDEILESRFPLTNEQFSQVIYNILSTKYYWREWLVISYAEVVGFANHIVSTCQGTHRFRKNGRNIIVSSVDRTEGDKAMSHMTRNKEIIGSYKNWGFDKMYARGWWSYMNKQLTTCNEVDTVAAIMWGSDVWYISTRLLIYKKVCVYNDRPCFNTFLFA